MHGLTRSLRWQSFYSALTEHDHIEFLIEEKYLAEYIRMLRLYLSNELFLLFRQWHLLIY